MYGKLFNENASSPLKFDTYFPMICVSSRSAVVMSVGSGSMSGDSLAEEIDEDEIIVPVLWDHLLMYLPTYFFMLYSALVMQVFIIFSPRICSACWRFFALFFCLVWRARYIPNTEFISSYVTGVIILNTDRLRISRSVSLPCFRD